MRKKTSSATKNETFASSSNERSSSSNNLFFLPVLLLFWVLIKLGSSLTASILKLLYLITSIRIKLLHLIVLQGKRLKNNLKIEQFSNHKRRRGRPRTQPFFSYLYSKWRRVLRKIFPTPFRIGFILVALLIAFFIYSILLIDVAHNLPSPEKLSSLQSPLTSEILDRSGKKLLYRFYEGKNRSLISLDQLPAYLIQATISMEDKNFYAHSGVDLFGVMRAIGAYLSSHEVQGGSTITQQLIKNTLLTPERTVQRKIKEIALAFWAERLFSKKEILQMYFNEVPYGGPAWGIEAAAQTYFGKSAKDLTLSESSYLAGLPASPTTYSPYGASPELGKLRQKEVLRRMVEDGHLTQAQADEVYGQELRISPPNQSIKAPHFVMYIRQLLVQKYGEKAVSQGGLKVVTSLDLSLQEKVENIVSEEVSKLTNLRVGNGAAMVTDPKTGQILAMVGSKNYWDPSIGNFNVATAYRQPGSSIKPITYAAAFKMGYTPGTVLLDTPVAFKNAWETYAPVNYDGRFHGPVTIRTALGSSYNVPAVKMLAIVGLDNMLQTAHDLGITTLNDKNRYGLSLTLGGGEVKLIDMMDVYGTFSQLGVRRDPEPILKVTDAQGIVLEDNTQNSGRRVLPEAVAYLITNILTDNAARTPAFGPASLLNIPGHTVAVKTGTTDNKRDNWTFGFTPEFVVGVWVGNNNNDLMDPQLTSGVTGAAPIWNKIMLSLIQDKPDVAFAKPAEVIQGVVDGRKDLMIAGVGAKSVIASRKEAKLKPSEKDTITFTDPFSTYKIDVQASPNP